MQRGAHLFGVIAYSSLTNTAVRSRPKKSLSAEKSNSPQWRRVVLKLRDYTVIPLHFALVAVVIQYAERRLGTVRPTGPGLLECQ